jgi:hypothetical protein
MVHRSMIWKPASGFVMLPGASPECARVGPDLMRNADEGDEPTGPDIVRRTPPQLRHSRHWVGYTVKNHVDWAPPPGLH